MQFAWLFSYLFDWRFTRQKYFTHLFYGSHHYGHGGEKPGSARSKPMLLKDLPTHGRRGSQHELTLNSPATRLVRGSWGILLRYRAIRVSHGVPGAIRQEGVGLSSCQTFETRVVLVIEASTFYNTQPTPRFHV